MEKKCRWIGAIPDPGKWTAARDRLVVLSGKRKDPFDTYEWLDSLHLYCRVRAYYFFLLANQPKGYDKNISPSHPAFQNLIKYHGKGYTLGIHPSWQSGDQEELLEEEISTLEHIAEKKVYTAGSIISGLNYQAPTGAY